MNEWGHHFALWSSQWCLMRSLLSWVCVAESSICRYVSRNDCMWSGFLCDFTRYQHCHRRIPSLNPSHLCEDNTTCHDVVERFFDIKTSRAMNSGKPILQDTECSLNVLSVLVPLQIQLLSLILEFEWSSQILPKTDRCRPQDNILLYSHAHWLCSCKPMHPH
jgi:hypothetical protein